MITIGRMTSVYGVKGWVKVFSYTEPMENIFQYQPWTLTSGTGAGMPVRVENWKKHGKGLIAKLEGISDRTEAMGLAGMEIQTAEENIPQAGEDEVYWRDVIGMSVVTLQGDHLGEVANWIETGANDVLVVKGAEESVDRNERLIPWVPGTYISDVDVAARRVTVDWHADWED